METLIIKGDSEQIATLKAFLKTVGIEFKSEEDPTDYLLNNSVNKKELIDSITEANEGKTKKVGLDDIWKSFNVDITIRNSDIKCGSSGRPLPGDPFRATPFLF